MNLKHHQTNTLSESTEKGASSGMDLAAPIICRWMDNAEQFKHHKNVSDWFILNAEERID